MIVLDTHVLVWTLGADRRVGKRCSRTIDEALAAGGAAVPAIVFWEVAMLIARGRLRIEGDATGFRSTALRTGFTEIPVDGTIAITAGRLTTLHGDPADRLIVATAIITAGSLLTADEGILRWKNPLRRIDARL